MFGKVSLYKNVLGVPGKLDQRYTELPLASSVTAESSNGIESTTHGFVTRGSGIGSLLYVPYDVQRKASANSWQASVGSVADFKISPGYPRHIAVAGEVGKVQVFADSEDYSISGAVTSFTPASKPLLLSYHPHAEALLATMSSDSLSLYDISSSTCLYDTASLAGKSSLCSVAWSKDGKLISCGARDGKIRTFDPRQPTSSTPVLEIQAHGGINKPAHITYLDSNNMFSTGFGKMRERELCLWDIRNPANSSKIQRLDQNTGSIFPVIDQSRGIVYLAGRGDVTLRWVEPLSTSPNMGLVSLPVNVPISGLCLTHSSILDIMHTEISKLLILSTASKVVSPVTLSVPRRQYADFHSELYPPIPDEKYMMSAPEWLAGSDVNRPEFIITPAKPGPFADTLPTTAQLHSATNTQINYLPKTSTVNTFSPQPMNSSLVIKTEPTPSVDLKSAETKASSTPIDSKTESVSVERAATMNPVTTISTNRDTPPQEPVPVKKTYVQSNAQSSKPAIRWTRKYIMGKKPLKPDYDGLGEISTMLSAHVQTVKSNPTYFFLPLSGPGGQLGFYELAKKGRLPVHFNAFMSGTEIVDFDLDPFDDRRIFVAGKDGLVKVFYVPEDLDLGDSRKDAINNIQPKLILDDGKRTRIQDIRCNPVAKDIFLTTSDDIDSTSLRVWDAANEKVLLICDVPGGAVASAWEPNGARVALITKDRRIIVLDPRSSSSNIIEGPSHESPRNAMLTWLNSSYLLTSGFMKSASREIIVHRIEGSVLEKVSSHIISSSSPAPLFPTFDPDTQILYLWAKGERTILSFDINLDSLDDTSSSSLSVLEPLPSFESSNLQISVSFLPKRVVDVTKVEIGRALRVAQKEIELVSFTIPRAKTEYFQDDIYVPTIDSQTPALSSTEWMAGKEYQPRYISLQPDNMKPLSQAPVQPLKPKTDQRQMIRTGVIKTDAQKQEEYLENLFQKAQLEGKESNDEDSADERKQVAPDDDDW